MKYKNIENGYYYHIFNRGINSCDIFKEQTNYEHFLRLYEKYINPIADTYAWVLMKNHFHFLVRIKEIDEINNNELYTPVRVQNPDRDVQPKKPHLYFSHLFNSYTQAFNKMYNRTGSLFERPFHRKKIDDERYLRNLIVYIHNNPVHHGAVKRIDDYSRSSYKTIISNRKTHIKKDEVVALFGDLDNFIYCHSTGVISEEMGSLLVECVDINVKQ